MSFKPQGEHIVTRCHFCRMFWQVWPSFFNQAHASLAATSESFSCGFWLFTSRFGERNLKTLQSSHEETFRDAGIPEIPENKIAPSVPSKSFGHVCGTLFDCFYPNFRSLSSANLPLTKPRVVRFCMFLQPSLLLLAETGHLYRKVSHGAHKNVPTAVPKPKIILKWITGFRESSANHILLKNYSKISPELLSLIQPFVET